MTQRVRAAVVALGAVLIVQSLGPSAVGALSDDGQGYWLAAADGGVFTFGDAPFLGSLADIKLNAPVVGIAPTPSGQGYWLAAADGGVFTFGDAPFLGSLADIKLNAPVVGIAPTPSGQGYWLAAADGGVFTFGDAPFLFGCPVCLKYAPFLGIASSPDSYGYALLGQNSNVIARGLDSGIPRCTYPPSCATAIAVSRSDGVIVLEGGYALSFDEPDVCRMVERIESTRLIALAIRDVEDGGCWLLGADGGVFTTPEAPFLGSLAGIPLNRPVVGIAPLPAGASGP